MIGRSRGGWTTKVHALTDVIGRPYALMLTAGNVGDIKAAPTLLQRAGHMRYLLADKGYDADQPRRSPRDAGAVPVIPRRRNRKRAIRYNKDHYRGRHLIENAFCRLKPVLSLSKGTSAALYPLRQARHQLPVRRGPRNRNRLLAVNESEPQTVHRPPPRCGTAGQNPGQCHSRRRHRRDPATLT